MAFKAEKTEHSGARTENGSSNRLAAQACGTLPQASEL